MDVLFASLDPDDSDSSGDDNADTSEEEEEEEEGEGIDIGDLTSASDVNTEPIL
jgi:hypothetical protein